jgi:1,6-anhydro-N-acetylmuramate kinase
MDAAELATLGREVGDRQVAAVTALRRPAHVATRDVDLVGCHGHMTRTAADVDRSRAVRGAA